MEVFTGLIFVVVLIKTGSFLKALLVAAILAGLDGSNANVRRRGQIW
jgi:hypothetical protein